MKRSRFSEEQIIGILREVQGGGNTRAVCAAHNISEGTYYAWKRKYGGMDVSEGTFSPISPGVNHFTPSPSRYS